MAPKITQAQDYILIDATYRENNRIAIVDSNGKLEELLLENADKKSVRHNIYLGTIVRIEHSLQAAFVDYGCGKNGFLPFSEIHPDYYQIPSFDREKLNQDLQEERNRIASAKQTEDDTTTDITDNEDSFATKDEQSEKKQSNYQVYQKYNIQEVIKRGQNVLVQVFKDERGNKGASLTTYINIAGRYCVFMPNSPNGIGISRKISNSQERQRITTLVKNFGLPDSMSVVVRTAGAEATEAELRRDYEYLIKTWEELRLKTLNSKTMSLIHEEGSLIRQVVRDSYNSKISNVAIEGNKETHADLLQAFEDFAPNDKHKIVFYENKIPLFTKYGMEVKIDELLQARIELDSGGYIIINPTEALVAIDVNSGKATTERNIEDMALKINIEAALEIARQVRLRDIGGLIVIDFIDMLSVRNRKTVENAVRSAFAADRAKVQFARISIFGLLELSRQRLRSSLMDVSTASCPACKGSGKIRSSEVVVNSIFRTIEGVIHLVTSNKITILCSREIGLALRNAKKQLLLELAKANAIEIDVKDDNSLLQEEFKIIEVMADATQNKVIAENTPPAVALVAEETSTMPQDDGAVPNYRFVKKKSREYDPSNKRRDGDRRDGQRRDRGPRRDGDKPYVKHGKGSIKKPVKSTGIFGAIKKFFS